MREVTLSKEPKMYRISQEN